MSCGTSVELSSITVMFIIYLSVSSAVVGTEGPPPPKGLVVASVIGALVLLRVAVPRAEAGAEHSSTCP